MKKFITVNIMFSLLLLVALFGTGCAKVYEKPIEEPTVWNNESAYAYAEELGYKGSLEEFIDKISGVGIKTITVSETFELIITLTDDTEINLGTVRGPQGEKGESGIDGTDGINGTNGSDGATPYIGTNGNWYIGNTDTGIKAEGKVGNDGINGTNGNDGETPYIGTNGNWYIGDTDTGVKAEGTVGKDGINGTNGNDGANGSDGANGENGLSAFEIYKLYYPEYSGTEEEWLQALVGNNNPQGLDFYPLNNGTEYGVKIGRAVYLSEITIPATYINKPVTEILDSAFSSANTLEIINIPASITSIGYQAFFNCTSLKHVNFAEHSTITDIGESAFSGCTSLLDVVIPGSVNGIGGYAFANSAGTISFAEGSAIANISANAFRDYNGTSITIPNSVTSIGEYAFANYAGVITFAPESLITVIGANMFRDYEGSSILIPEGVTQISGYAFYNCVNLMGLSIPAGVTSIGEYAFYYVKGIITFAENSAMTSIVANTFREFRGTEIVLSDGITELGNYSFQNCINLTDVTLPNQLATIGEGAFTQCSSLRNIIIPSSVTAIGSCAFSYATGTIKFAAGSLLTSINYQVFKYYYGNVITLPTGLTNINNYSFEACSQLTAIIMDVAAPPTLGMEAFYNIYSNIKIYVPEGSVDTYKAASVWSDYASKIYSLSLIDANGFAVESDILLQYVGTESSVTVPNSITGIGANAFAYNKNIVNVTIQSGVTSIGNGAFYYCNNLITVSMPDTLLSLGSNAFSNCTKMETVVIPASVTSIGDSCFYNCTALKSVTVNAVSVPTLGIRVFVYAYNSSYVLLPYVQIYVPAESLEAYKAASNWSTYTGRIKEII